MKYQDILTEKEITSVVNAYLQTDKADGEKVKDILDLLAFYGECSMIFSGIISGEFIITGMGESGIEYRLSEKSKRRLH